MNGLINNKEAIIIFRVDAGTEIGTGHLMRCLALAQIFNKKGNKTLFLTHCENDNLLNRLTKEGFEIIKLVKSYPAPSDLNLTVNVIKEIGKNVISWLILDGYHFDDLYQKTIKSHGINLMVIDDMGHLPYYHADIILNQNINARDISYNISSNTMLLLGLKYILLREEFLRWSGWKRTIPDKARRILITMGGSDSMNATLLILKMIKKLKLNDIEISVVIGPSNNNIMSIENEISEYSGRYKLLKNIDDMSKLIAWADIAISAGGTTCWEMCYMGLPNLIVVLAENQRMVADYLDKSGASINLGFYKDMDQELFAEKFMSLIMDREKRIKMSETERALVDGYGALRVLDVLNTANIQNWHSAERHSILPIKKLNE